MCAGGASIPSVCPSLALKEKEFYLRIGYFLGKIERETR
ncbi:hypothetical protein POREN0001_1765 [Porphyromonas endodontalis ATCC 35406]|uniref:Uncharacterized protein n=1 Tax=Porphyromonas endodontalis (strain ATCC 35406 / DSM 24491 / JCM 8526 / CCUG 16442 / BCRC 14492 / NCTC 13058 / HG 370) TaxID=553175 RepID=C3JBN0_POREA|nr:hypothetical protein POREN0001_1765 [Porphyromonas endodontalis ATCC 35406]